MPGYVSEPFTLDGRVALVTGGPSGIGRHVARALACAGTNVVLIGRRAHLLQDAAESVCASRAITPAIGKMFLKTFQAYMDEVIEPNKTSDLSETQPTKGNIQGGLTTIEEKAFGNLEKIDKKAK